MKRLFKHVYKKDFEFNFSSMFLLSDKTKKRFSNYLSIMEYSHRPLYYNLFTKFFVDFQFNPELDSDIFDPILLPAGDYSKVSLNRDKLQHDLKTELTGNNIFYFYNNFKYNNSNFVTQFMFRLISDLGRTFDNSTIETDYFYSFEHNNVKYCAFWYNYLDNRLQYGTEMPYLRILEHTNIGTLAGKPNAPVLSQIVINLPIFDIPQNKLINPIF